MKHISAKSDPDGLHRPLLPLVGDQHLAEGDGNVLQLWQSIACRAASESPGCSSMPRWLEVTCDRLRAPQSMLKEGAASCLRGRIRS